MNIKTTLQNYNHENLSYSRESPRKFINNNTHNNQTPSSYYPIWSSSEKSTTRTTQINLNNHLQARSTGTQTKPNTNQPRIKTQKLKRKIIYLDETNFLLQPVSTHTTDLSLSLPLNLPLSA